MPTSMDDILTPPWDQPIPPRWIEPHLTVIDDISALTVLPVLHDNFNPQIKPAHPDRLCIISQIDRENALPDRLRNDDLLQTFAQELNIRFIRNSTPCDSGSPLPDDMIQPNQIIASTTPPTALGALGGLGISVNARDLTHALQTGKIWYRRPPVQAFHIHGTPKPTVTLHDIAIALRPVIHQQSLLLFTITDEHDKPIDTLASPLTALLTDSPAAWVSYQSSIPGEITTTQVHLDQYQPMIGIGNDSALPLSKISPTPIDRAYIGSCSTGSVDDLRLAAQVLTNHQVAVQTVIAPSSIKDAELLETALLNPDDPSSPTLAKIFHDSGCDIGLPGCNTCVNAIADLLNTSDHSTKDQYAENMNSSNLTVIATAVGSVTARSVAQIFTASPATAAQAAVRGVLTSS